MNVPSLRGNKVLLVVVDRASKFPSASPLSWKDALGVSRKLLELLLIFDLPLAIRSDPGGEFTAEIMRHLRRRWLKLKLDFGPANHPRAQGTVERLGGWLQEIITELCISWPNKWDDDVSVATSIYRMEPDDRLPNKASPYRMFFGREPRTPPDQLSPTLDNSGPPGTNGGR